MRRGQSRRAVWIFALAVALISSASCKRAKAPLAKLEVRPAQLELAWPRFVELDFELAPIAPLPAGVERPILFVHLLDEPGSVVRTFDHELPGEWKPGSALRYRRRIYQSALASPLPPGRYLLSVGLYDPEAGRFALESVGPEIAKLEYQVATVEVPPTTAAGPEARFSGEWLPPESLEDRQILAARKLRGGAPGRIGFGPVSGPGLIHLGIVVPAASQGARLEVAGGETQPKVKLSSSCGGEQSEVSGTGRFDLDIVLPAGTTAASCEIVVEPNFVLRIGDRADLTSVRLEELSFRAGEAAEP
jgi:hypothetical protein